MAGWWFYQWPLLGGETDCVDWIELTRPSEDWSSSRCCDGSQHLKRSRLFRDLSNQLSREHVVRIYESNVTALIATMIHGTALS